MKGGIPYPIYETYRNLRQREEIVEAHNFCIYTVELLIKFLASLAIGYYLHKRKEKHPEIDQELLSLRRPSLVTGYRFFAKSIKSMGKIKISPSRDLYLKIEVISPKLSTLTTIYANTCLGNLLRGLLYQFLNS